MRLVKRDELMTMPAGTIYQEYDPAIIGPLMMKEDTCESDGQNIDWYESPIAAQVDLHANVFELGCTVCREACYDDGKFYLVHEAADIEYMIARLQGAASLPERTLPLPE
jgi:hypothetical protein